jgi:hypothetical protein
MRKECAELEVAVRVAKADVREYNTSNGVLQKRIRADQASLSEMYDEMGGQVDWRRR